MTSVWRGFTLRSVDPFDDDPASAPPRSLLAGASRLRSPLPGYACADARRAAGCRHRSLRAQPIFASLPALTPATALVNVAPIVKCERRGEFWASMRSSFPGHTMPQPLQKYCSRSNTVEDGFSRCRCGTASRAQRAARKVRLNRKRPVCGCEPSLRVVMPWKNSRAGPPQTATSPWRRGWRLTLSVRLRPPN